MAGDAPPPTAPSGGPPDTGPPSTTTPRSPNDENAPPAGPRHDGGADASAPSADGGGGSAGGGGSSARRKRRRYEPYKDDRAASKAMYKQKATLVARAHALAADTGAEVFLFVAGPSGRSWQYATPRLAAGGAGLSTPDPDGGGDAHVPLFTRHGAGGHGGAVAQLLRAAAGAAAGPALPHGPVPHTDTMADPPGVPDLLQRGVDVPQQVFDADDEGGGGGPPPAAGPPPPPVQPAPPPAPHRPWPGAATLVTGPDGGALLALAP